MYIPEHFRERHHADTIAFMRANPFAILISSADDGPFATHLPLSVQAEDEKLILRGHVAKANPHWRYLERAAGVSDDFPWASFLHLAEQLHELARAFLRGIMVRSTSTEARESFRLRAQTCMACSMNSWKPSSPLIACNGTA